MRRDTMPASKNVSTKPRGLQRLRRAADTRAAAGDKEGPGCAQAWLLARRAGVCK